MTFIGESYNDFSALMLQKGLFLVIFSMYKSCGDEKDTPVLLNL